MTERILGIDLGISSLGWAVVEHDAEHEENNSIVGCGVRLFTAAQTPKDHKSLNEARRNARGIRRVIKRRRVRMNQIKKLCIDHRLLQKNDFDLDNGMFNSPANRTDVWQLRHDALYRLLSGNELARVMIHIAKHRGYKFIGDNETDEESGKVKTAGKALKATFEAAGCLSIGEWLWRERQHNGKKRNRNVYDPKQKKKIPDYELSIPRDFLENEMKVIFDKQQKLGSTLATNELLSAWKVIALYVRPMQSIENMVGKCTFFPHEKRAPKSAPTAEKFVALGKFFATVVVDHEGKERKIIELKTVNELMHFVITKATIDYKQLRDFLGLKNDFSTIFKGLSYKSKKSETTEWKNVIKETETKPWISLKGHATFKKVLGDEGFNHFIANNDLADKIATVLTYYKDEGQKKEELAKLSLDPHFIETLYPITFTDFNNLSLKAMRIISSIMSDGYQRYDEAVHYAMDNGLLPKITQEKAIFLPPLKATDIAILNPTVIRAFAQFRKIANALVKKYGTFDKVHFELAREVNTQADINAMKEGQLKNEKERDATKRWMAENFPLIPPTRKNILKKRLFDQQGEFCPYTNEKILVESLFDEGYCEIDHILPRSRSGDDSQANKVLCMTQANQEKTNRTPYEWFGHDALRWEHFEARMNTHSNLAKMGKGKVSRLLKKNFDDNSQNEFLSRNLNDTRYMSKAIKSYCERYWKLAHDDDKLRIQVRSGKLTSELRYRWIEGYMKDRNIHTHHALDAIVIAFATQSMVQKLSHYYKAKETRHEKAKPIFNPPMEHFRHAVEEALTLERTETIITKDGREIPFNRLLISRPPRASVTGAAHKETIQRPSDYKGRGVSVNSGKGMCDNGDMPRVDVFTKRGKYYLVPIYVVDFAKKALPNITAYGEELAEDAQFLFSLYKDEIISISTKATANKPAKEVKGFFMQLIGPSILLNTIDNGAKEFFINTKINGKYTCQLNVLNALKVKKYTIDPLGYYHEVRGEKRLGTIPQETQKRKR
jgi:CRISPR-associated endonuclease Csn1